MHCLKYGLTVHNVLRVRGFTAEGEPVEFGSEALDTPGYDLLAAVIGSEGMLAVTTEATVRLIPRPQLARCIMASFDDVRKAGDAVAAVIAAGIIPAGLEMMDKPMTAAVEDFVQAGYDLAAEAILLCESDGTPEEVEEEIGRMSEVLRAAGATAITVSENETERLRFWSGRKNAFPASGRISPDYMCLDSTIPRKRLADILLAIQEMEKKYGLRCCNVFHAGDGNLHPLVLFDANDPDELHRCELFGADILETSVAMGGTVSGEHGVGVEKLNSMCTQFTTEENAQMFALKAAFDPAGLLNPGKVIPTVSRCAEYGKDAGARRADAAPGPAPVLEPARPLSRAVAACCRTPGTACGDTVHRRCGTEGAAAGSHPPHRQAAIPPASSAASAACGPPFHRSAVSGGPDRPTGHRRGAVQRPAQRCQHFQHRTLPPATAPARGPPAPARPPSPWLPRCPAGRAPNHAPAEPRNVPGAPPAAPARSRRGAPPDRGARPGARAAR